MASCLPIHHGLKTRKHTLQPPTPLAPSSDTNPKHKDHRHSCILVSAEEHGKENTDVGKHSHHNWLAKVCNKFRGRHRGGRAEKCEKCGQKSETCQVNASYITSRKHYLCEECRGSCHTMNMRYQQLYRNFSLHEPPRVVGGGGNNDDLSPPTRKSRGVVRSRSMRTRPLPPESGYDTATSLDSSCSCGRLSPESVYGSPGERGLLRPDCGSLLCVGFKPAEPYSARDSHLNHHKDKSEVFGGAFKSEKAHLRDIQPRLPTRVYTRQDPPPPPPPYRPKATTPANPQNPGCKNTTNYDGYLEIRNPNSKGVKYVFRQREDCERVLENDEVQSDHLSRRRHTENLKLCYRCNKFRCIAFRAPFDNGWLCEDCMDDLM